MVPCLRSAEYSGLMAAPGTPKACVTPSFSITRTAAWAAVIFAMKVSLGVRRTLGRRGSRQKGARRHKAYSMQE